MSLEEYRKKIDSIDVQLIKLIAERLALMPEIAQFKKANNLPIFQPEREKQLLEERKKLARELNINPDLIEAVFKSIISECRKTQDGKA